MQTALIFFSDLVFNICDSTNCLNYQSLHPILCRNYISYLNYLNVEVDLPFQEGYTE